MGKEKLGSYVADRRKTLALRQSDLADALSYTSQAISKFEAGENSISIAVLPSLANHLKISLDDLLERNPHPAPYGTPSGEIDGKLLSENLTALRNNHHLSQEKEAALLGVSKRTLIHYEQGDTLPSLDALEALLEAFHLSPSCLFYSKIPLESATKSSSNPQKKKHLVLLLSLSLGAVVLIGCATPAVIYWQKSARPAGNLNEDFSSSVSSPYLPGLSHLLLKGETGEYGNVHLGVDTPYKILVDSGSFSFADFSTYALRIDFKDKSLSNCSFVLGEDGLSGSVSFDSTTPDQGVYTLQVYAYAVDHPSDGVYGGALVFTLDHPEGADVATFLPGLKSVSLVVGPLGTESQLDYYLAPGDYPFRLVTTPGDYFSLHSEITVTYSLQLGDDSFILTPPTSQAEGRVKVVNQGRDNAKDYLWATLANALGQKYTINCGLLLSV